MSFFEKKKYTNRYFTTAIIAAAGSGTRMGSQGNKQLIYLKDKTVIAHTIKAFEEAELIDEIIVSAKKEVLEDISKEVSNHNFKKVALVISGGETRQQSVFSALSEVSQKTKFVAVHDGARPFIEASLIDKVCENAYIHKCAALGVKVKDTIKAVDSKGFIAKTIDRDGLRAIQTPQVFDIKLYLKAMAAALQNNRDYTDDCQLIESVGGKVFFVEGSYLNLKITTNEDILLAQSILNEENSSCSE